MIRTKGLDPILLTPHDKKSKMTSNITLTGNSSHTIVTPIKPTFSEVNIETFNQDYTGMEEAQKYRTKNR